MAADDHAQMLRTKFLSGCRTFSIDPSRQPVALETFEWGVAQGYLDKEVVVTPKEILELDEDEVHWVYHFTEKATRELSRGGEPA